MKIAYDKNVGSELCKNFYDNLNRNLCCDLLLLTNDNKQIPVHKIVLLSSTSSYLKSLIKSHIKSTELHVPICSNQLEIIVKYLYTGDVNVTDLSETKALYESGRIFLLPFIQKYSTNKLLTSLTLAFSLEYFRHAVKYSIENLEEKCLELIKTNTKEFFDTFLQDLTSNELERIMKIRKELKISEIDLYRFIRNWIFIDFDFRKQYIDEIMLQHINFSEITSVTLNEEIVTDPKLKFHANFLQQVLLAYKMEQN